MITRDELCYREKESDGKKMGKNDEDYYCNYCHNDIHDIYFYKLYSDYLIQDNKNS